MTARAVDASFVSSLFFDGQADRSSWLAIRTPGETFAPDLLRQEIANASLRLERRGLATSGQAEAVLQALVDDIAVTFLHDPSWVVRAIAVARRFAQARIYDAIYLACAEDLGAELWTRDRRFAESFGDARPPLLRLYPDDIA